MLPYRGVLLLCGCTENLGESTGEFGTGCRVLVQVVCPLEEQLLAKSCTWAHSLQAFSKSVAQPAPCLVLQGKHPRGEEVDLGGHKRDCSCIPPLHAVAVTPPLLVALELLKKSTKFTLPCSQTPSQSSGWAPWKDWGDCISPTQDQQPS